MHQGGVVRAGRFDHVMPKVASGRRGSAGVMAEAGRDVVVAEVPEGNEREVAQAGHCPGLGTGAHAGASV
ncbi:hypothetical protein HS99_0009350 [Kitasatospora aureofaciens]|uniref:Uncharacterized protein n=1 Tax=Kitasatospora aureofaciens TaxID=1894 RepID=A0A1E7N1X3_KITAU|nr:hypothetical protein B6264_26430 [Kitasatospora aureofaciens]OEV34684.1 hypothetical protein HS99_0009350 [Kitasatospora aureofaciens]